MSKQFTQKMAVDKVYDDALKRVFKKWAVTIVAMLISIASITTLLVIMFKAGNVGNGHVLRVDDFMFIVFIDLFTGYFYVNDMKMTWKKEQRRAHIDASKLKRKFMFRNILDI